MALSGPLLRCRLAHRHRRCWRRGLASARAGADVTWRPAPGGRLGVFADRGLAAGQVAERCYCLALAGAIAPRPCLRRWLYRRGEGQPLLLPLGWGLLYNERPCLGGDPNLTCEYEERTDSQGCSQWYVTLRANRAVEPGEELCVPRQLAGEDASPLQDMASTALEATRAELEAEAARSPRASLEAGLEQLAGLAEVDSSSVHIGNLPLTSDVQADIMVGIIHAPRDVEVRHSPVHGNGVFARQPLPKDTVVEIAPNLLVMRDWLGQSLADYCYQAFEPDCGARKLALGLGSVYNHSDEPNLKYCIATATGVGCSPAQRLSTRYYTARDVEEGEELFIHYGQSWWSSRGL